MCFGSTGMFEQDDVENWVSLTTTAGGAMARRLLLNSRMGLLADDRPVVGALAANCCARAGSRPGRLRPVQPARPARLVGGLPVMTKSLPFNDVRHLEAHQFLVDEAFARRPAVRRVAGHADRRRQLCHAGPRDHRAGRGIRRLAGTGAGDGALRRGQVLADPAGRARFATEHAWTEDPPSPSCATWSATCALLSNSRMIEHTWWCNRPNCCFAAAGTSTRAPWCPARPRGYAAVVRRSLEIGPAQHHCRRICAADAEPGGVPVEQPITVANEFAEVEVRRVDTRNGSRLLISAPRAGRSISLDTWNWRR